MINRKKVLIGIGVGFLLAILLAVAFFAGVSSVSRGNRFSLFDKRNNMMKGFKHGLVGTIKSINKNSLIVSNRVGTEKNVTVDDQAKIVKDQKTIKLSDLKVNDQVAILGEPDQEEKTIKAKVIRVINLKSGFLMHSYRYQKSS